MADIRNVHELRAALPALLGDAAQYVGGIEMDGPVLVLRLVDDPDARFRLEGKLGALDAAIRQRAAFPFACLRLARAMLPTDQPLRAT